MSMSGFMICDKCNKQRVVMLVYFEDDSMRIALHCGHEVKYQLERVEMDRAKENKVWELRKKETKQKRKNLIKR